MVLIFVLSITYPQLIKAIDWVWGRRAWNTVEKPTDLGIRARNGNLYHLGAWWKGGE
jgi:hypothetical protein